MGWLSVIRYQLFVNGYGGAEGRLLVICYLLMVNGGPRAG